MTIASNATVLAKGSGWHFSVENVKSFEQFLKGSKGFEIWWTLPLSRKEIPIGSGAAENKRIIVALLIFGIRFLLRQYSSKALVQIRVVTESSGSLSSRWYCVTMWRVSTCGMDELSDGTLIDASD
jgi:hypothetical protein